MRGSVCINVHIVNVCACQNNERAASVCLNVTSFHNSLCFLHSPQIANFSSHVRLKSS